MSVKAKYLVVALGLAAGASRASVNVNNGNFYVAYTDFFVPTPGLNLEITRTYNSRSNYLKGWFGVGWSSEMEGYLNVDGENVSFFEGGGGNVVKFARKGKVWENSLFGQQTLEKTSTGWVLHAASGKDLAFTEKGKLAKISDKNKNFIELTWGNDGLVSGLRDNHNNQIKLKWGDFGGSPRLTLLEMGDKKARYEYSPAGDLLRATGIDSVPYVYNYDDEHNMTKIVYHNGDTKEMAYNKGRDWVTKFKDRDGTSNQYDYFADKLDPENKFGTTLVRANEGTGEKETTRFWYEFRRRADGGRYNYRAVTWIGATVTETLFTECCGTPQVVSQWELDPAKKETDPARWTMASANKKSTYFEYYTDGMLKKKTTPDGVVTLLTYDDKQKKVASVTRDGRKVEYHYDDRGNLAWAVDGRENRRIDLTYDLKGRITLIQEKGFAGNKALAKSVYFRYNADGRPVEIKEKAGAFSGSIKIAYSPAGDVLGILNGQGRTVASEKEVESVRRVASTFQNLLEIVQPAGVSLTPEG